MLIDRNPEAEAALAQQLIGTTVGGRYTLDEYLGQGGFAVTFRATDHRMETHVAVKVAKPGADTQLIERFRNETLLGARLPSHPSVARATDRGHVQGSDFDSQPYLVTDLVDGDPLNKLLTYRSGALPVDRVLHLAADLIDALDFLHAQGVVHRDVKPDNIIINRHGKAVLIDFGIAFATGHGHEPRSPDLTEARQIVGTPHYMSPEQAAGTRPQCSFDIYALGATLYESLCGTPPHGHVEGKLVVRAKLSDKVPPIARLRRDTPPELGDIVDAMLCTLPEQRPTAGSLRKQIHALLSSPSPAAVSPLRLPSTAKSPPSKLLKHATVAVLATATLGTAAGALFTPRDADVASLGFKFRFENAPPKREAAPPIPQTPEQEGPDYDAHLPLEAEPKENSSPPPAPEPRKKRRHRRPPPASDVDCKAERTAAKKAASVARWKSVVRHTKHGECWPDRENWQRLRIQALFHTHTYEACVRLGKNSNDHQAQRYARVCAAKMDSPLQ